MKNFCEHLLLPSPYLVTITTDLSFFNTFGVKSDIQRIETGVIYLDCLKYAKLSWTIFVTHLSLYKEVKNFLKNFNIFHVTNKIYNLKIRDFPLMYVMYTQISITQIFTSFP